MIVNKVLSDEERYDALKNLHYPQIGYKFPQTSFGKINRSFQSQWLSKYHGLVYSVSCDGAFCLHCVLFCKEPSKHGQLVSEPFRNWKKATEKFDEHLLKKRHNSGDTSVKKKPGSGYESHKENYTMSENFRRRMENTQEDVIVALNTGLQERKIRNLAVLETIVKIVLLCGQQNLALRGHRDDSQYTNDKNINTGNFSALLRYRADGGDELLQEHFKNAPSNATSISKTTQNEVISIIRDSIQRSIMNDCNEAGGWFSLSADEVRDTANKEQLVATIRYVDKEKNIKENLLCFRNVSADTSGESLSKELLTFIDEAGLDRMKMYSQCYDGAGNMAGKVKGVGPRIQKQLPKKLPFWCTAHQLNRCIVQACNIPSVRNLMCTSDQVVKFFEYSPKKQTVLEKLIDETVNDETSTTNIYNVYL